MIKKYSDPFPHIIIENFLDDEECGNIINEINLDLKNFKSNLVMGGRKRIFSNYLKKNTSSYKFYNTLNTLKKFDYF